MLVLAYLFIDNRLHLREEQQRRQEAARDRREARERILGVVHGELESNAVQLNVALATLPTHGIPYPLFELASWPLVCEPVVFTTLNQDTIRSLTRTYNRLRTANEQCALLSDINHGATATLAAALSATAPNHSDQAIASLNEHRREIRSMLIERLGELKQHLDGAIDAVEGELRLEVARPAAQRLYVAE